MRKLLSIFVVACALVVNVQCASADVGPVEHVRAAIEWRLDELKESRYPGVYGIHRNQIREVDEHAPRWRWSAEYRAARREAFRCIRPDRNGYTNLAGFYGALGRMRDATR